jgi:PhzF family phenazine biosynthesis protein
MKLPFAQVDVFSPAPGLGNALAVVADAEGLSDEQLRTFARWTNLSETTYLLPPTEPAADYRVRILTPTSELPFAGHPTLGTCAVWLARGGQPKAENVVQECGIGLVRIRRDGGRLAFAAPPLRRSGEVDAATLAQVADGLRLDPSAILAAEHVDNGPPWIAVALVSRDEVLALNPDYAAMGDLDIGVFAPWGEEGEPQFEVRTFVGGAQTEDPVTGSFNAGLAVWMIRTGLAPAHYVASQGTVLQRRGRVFVDQERDTIWVGGEVQSLIEGTVTL